MAQDKDKIPHENGEEYPGGLDNAWSRWRQFVLAELKRLNSQSEELNEKIDTVRMEIVSLKIKAGLWGAVAGAIPAILWIVMYFISKGVAK